MKKKPEIQSWKNLESAFAGESMAYQKYLYFAKVARKNGDEDVAKLFEETASHETKHAQGHLHNLYPMKDLTTKQCLELAVEGENYEYTEMYPGFSQTAKDEGMKDWMIDEFESGIVECKEHSEKFIQRLEKLSSIFQGLSKVEKEHHDNYAKTLEDYSNAKGSHFADSNSFLKDSKLFFK